MKNISKLILVLLIAISSFIDANATGEASTYFQIYVPPNAQISTYNANLVIILFK